MNTTVTSRHFKAHGTLVEYAEDAVAKLERYYDGILKCEVKLSFEKARNSVKVAEIVLTVYKSKIAALQTTDDFNKSIDGAVEKVLVQLKKYKEKLHAKDRKQVRRVQAKVQERENDAMTLDNFKETRRESITVGYFFESNKERLRMTSANGEVGYDKVIRDRSIHRPGLALAGYVELFTYDRVQVVGNTEVRYLRHLSLSERIHAVETLLHFDIPCIIITNDNVLDPELLAIATQRGIAVFQTPLETTKLVYFVSDILDDQFSPQTVVHGSFMDVYGIGVALVGRSGIGKSEIALDLVERGHRLVADDVIMVTRKGEGILIGAGTDVVKHFMEIRGLGLIDIRSVFGIRSIRFQKRVEILVELQEWKNDLEYTRTGLDHESISILGVDIPHVKLPIFPGKNITVIVEVIALDYLLKHYGHDSAKEFAKRLDAAIAEKTKGRRAIDYFEHDFE